MRDKFLTNQGIRNQIYLTPRRGSVTNLVPVCMVGRHSCKSFATFWEALQAFELALTIRAQLGKLEAFFSPWEVGE